MKIKIIYCKIFLNISIFLVDAIVCAAQVFFSFIRINTLQVSEVQLQQIFQTEATFYLYD